MTWLDALHLLGWVSAVVGVACILGALVALIDCAVKRGAEYGANRLPTIRIKLPIKNRTHFKGVIVFPGRASDDAIDRLDEAMRLLKRDSQDRADARRRRELSAASSVGIKRIH